MAHPDPCADGIILIPPSARIRQVRVCSAYTVCLLVVRFMLGLTHSMMSVARSGARALGSQSGGKRPAPALFLGGVRKTDWAGDANVIDDDVNFRRKTAAFSRYGR